MEKDIVIDKAIKFPHVFKVLPIVDGKPTEPGTWSAYPHDNVTIFWINSSHTEALKYYSELIKFQEESRMSKALTVQEESTIKNMIASNIKAIKSVLPKHLTPERMMRIAFTSLTKNPTLGRCTQISLMNAIIEASILGLEVGGPLRQAALIPFKNNRLKDSQGNPAYEATLVVEYPGLITLAKNTGNVKNVTAHPVFEGDQFKYNYGLMPDLQHIPFSGANPGKLTHAYAIVYYMDGGVDFEVIGEKVAIDAKNRSAARFQKDSPWNKPEDQPAMWVKTAIRRLMNRVPKSAEIVQKMDAENRSGQDMDHIVDISLDDFQSVNVQPVKQIDHDASDQQQIQQRQPEKPVELTESHKQILQQLGAVKSQPEYLKACENLNINQTMQPDEQTAIALYAEINRIIDEDE